MPCPDLAQYCCCLSNLNSPTFVLGGDDGKSYF
jgi:hypothetical protein